MAEHLKSYHKDPTVDGLFSFIPQKLIYKFNVDKANGAFVVPFKKRQQNNLFKTESQQQMLSHVFNYSSLM